MKYIDRTCSVYSYYDMYTTIVGVLIITTVTGYTSSDGRSYILILSETLWMPSLQHSLINPDRLRVNEVLVQDNPYYTEYTTITSNDDQFR